jgi:predicted DNA-binding mobile mystery protein A
MGGVSMKARKAADESGGGGGAGHSTPQDGWIRTMRHARGVSLRQLGTKLGIKGNSVHVAERREIEGGISIYQLRRIAQALECDLFYAFVPRQQAGGGVRPSQKYAAALQARGAGEAVDAVAAVVESAPAAKEKSLRPVLEE